MTRILSRTEITNSREQSVVVLKVVEHTHDCTVLVVRIERLETDIFQCDILLSTIGERVRHCHVNEVLLKVK